MKNRIISLFLCLLMCLSAASLLVGCDSGSKGGSDALVIMTDALDGVFNPFFSTTGADSTIVSMTQIGMLTTG